MNESVLYYQKEKKNFKEEKEEEEEEGKSQQKKKKKSVRFERERERAVCLFVCFVGDLLFPLASSARSSRGLFFSSSSSSSSSPRRWVSVRGKEKKRNLIFSKSVEEGRRVF